MTGSVIAAVATLGALGLALGAVLGLAAKHVQVAGNPLEDKVADMLPGSNCGQCGYPGCRQMAKAVVQGEAAVTGCPPGGRALAAALAEVMGVSIDLSETAEPEQRRAFIHEDQCIGCLRCLSACSTDAIVGGPKQMHTVITAYCHGCGECVPTCPVDCIEMRPVPVTLKAWHWPKPDDLSEAA